MCVFARFVLCFELYVAVFACSFVPRNCIWVCGVCTVWDFFVSHDLGEFCVCCVSTIWVGVVCAHDLGMCTMCICCSSHVARRDKPLIVRGHYTGFIVLEWKETSNTRKKTEPVGSHTQQKMKEKEWMWCVCPRFGLVYAEDLSVGKCVLSWIWVWMWSIMCTV